MSEQNKEPGTSSVPVSTDKGGKTPEPGNRGPNTGKTPDHEQGREHIPNISAQNDAADSRRKDEQTRVPTTTGNTPAGSNSGTKDRQEDEAGDAKRSMADAQGSGKPGHDPVKPTGDTKTGGNR